MRTISCLAVIGAMACTDSTGSSSTGSTAPPTFSPPAGTYASAQAVTISSATPNAAVHCTQDGSVPTAASPTCAGPLVVSSTTTVRAIATAPGLTPSVATSATFTIDSGAVSAAPPTFSPPAGTYASAQTVTLSSATPGAVIHCTQDGSVPTAASPTCAGPLVVSSTTTVRAIATAPGHTPSAVASATFAISSATILEKLQALSSKRTWFVHMSVGYHIYSGELADNASGLGGLIAANPGSGTSVVYVYNPNESRLAGMPAGQFTHSLTGADTGDPVGKVQAFAASLGPTFGGGLDYAGLKFCYSDFRANTLARNEEAWVAYRDQMDALEAAHPGRLIFWTVPLTDYDGDNQVREAFSQRIRDRYGSTGRVFDVADLEATDPSGQPVRGVGGVRTIYVPYTFDGGHPNVAGANYLAQAYLDFLYAVEMGTPPP